MSDAKLPAVPRPNKTDAACTIAEGVVGMVPVVGSLVEAVYRLCIVPPFQKNVQAFLGDVVDALTRHGIAIERLGDDQRFHAAAIQAAIIAGRTKDEAKRRALRNAVVNVVKRTADEAFEEVFLAWLDTMTPTHLLLLDVLDHPAAWYRRMNMRWPSVSSLALMLNVATKYGADLIVPVYADLRARGLVIADDCAAGMGFDEPKKPQTTQIGRRFVEFIREPTE